MLLDVSGVGEWGGMGEGGLLPVNAISQKVFKQLSSSCFSLYPLILGRDDSILTKISLGQGVEWVFSLMIRNK